MKSIRLHVFCRLVFYAGAMIKRCGYKFEVKTNARQAEHLSQFAGACRFLWNRTLSAQKERLDRGERILRYGATAKELTQLKKELAFLKEVHSQILQQALMDLDRAWKDGFSGKKGYPRFKRKFQHDSFRFPQGFKVDGHRVYLPKFGWLIFRKSREIEGTIKNVIVSRDVDRWYVSFQTEQEMAEPVHPSETAVGIDLGVKRFATFSDGTVVQPVNAFRKSERKLRKAQRSLARKLKKSSNWNAQKEKVQKLHQKIRNIRKDFHHKLTTAIAKNHGTIVMENLKVKNMSKSAKGTIEEPGTNVAAKRGLNKSIADQGWYEFKRQLIYKQEWLGGRVVLVNPVNTSLTCSKCKYIDAENRKTQSQFECKSCDYRENADLNAAKNILAAGHAVLACGDIRQDAA